MAEHSDPAGSEITVYAGQRPRYPGVGGFLVLTGATPLTGSQGPVRAALSMLDGRRRRDDLNTSTGDRDRRGRRSMDSGAGTTQTPRPRTGPAWSALDG